MKNFFICAITLLGIATVPAQTSSLIVSSNLALPKDAGVRTQLLASLDGFLTQAQKPARDNPFILKTDRLETSLLLDEFKDIARSSRFNEADFYKAHLLKALELDDTNFLIQLGYIGVTGSVPTVRAVFSFNARKQDDQFYFCSPLKQNTATWKSEVFGSTRVYFKDALNRSNATAYFKLVDKFDRKLSAPNLPAKFYCCDNFPEVLRLNGIDYKSDYNGTAHSTLSAHENGEELIVNGVFTSNFTNFDPHDLWHSRLHNVLSVAIINRPVDEGTAYLYGGSWGLGWQQILEKFKALVEVKKDADWVSLYNEGKVFGDKDHAPLMVNYVINALLVQKIEKEKGFAAVLELLSCGKKEEDNANYFRALKKIAGITKASFGETVWGLIQASH